MARKKYIKDYRLIETVDERGHIRSDYEYIGGDYFYVLCAKDVKREKKVVMTAIAAGWLAFLGALMPDAAGMRAIWVALPFVFTALPLGLLTGAMLSAAREEPLQRRQADILEDRYPAAALWAMCLPCAALLGELVCLILGTALNAGDGIFALCALLTAGCGFFVFSRRARFACRKDGDPNGIIRESD